MAKKSALIITPTRKASGGVETMNIILENVLYGNDYEVEYITADNEEGKVPLWVTMLTKLFGRPVITSYRFKKLNRKFDVVICNGEFSFGINHENILNYFHGSFLGVMVSQRSVLTFRQKMSLKYQSFIQLWGSFNKRVIAVSDFLKEILGHQGIKTHYVVNNPVDLERFKIHSIDGRKDFLFVGSGNYLAKGIDILVELGKLGLNINCYGRGEFKGLNDKGFASHDEFPKIYNEHRYLIFPSRFEASSLVVLEALSCGLPVLMTEVGIGPDLKRSIPEFVLPLNSTPQEYLDRIDLIEKNYGEYCHRARIYACYNHSLSMYESAWVKILKEKVVI